MTSLQPPGPKKLCIPYSQLNLAIFDKKINILVVGTWFCLGLMDFPSYTPQLGISTWNIDMFVN